MSTGSVQQDVHLCEQPARVELGRQRGHVPLRPRLRRSVQPAQSVLGQLRLVGRLGSGVSVVGQQQHQLPAGERVRAARQPH